MGCVSVDFIHIVLYLLFLKYGNLIFYVVVVFCFIVKQKCFCFEIYKQIILIINYKIHFNLVDAITNIQSSVRR